MPTIRRAATGPRRPDASGFSSAYGAGAQATGVNLTAVGGDAMCHRSVGTTSVGVLANAAGLYFDRHGCWRRGGWRRIDRHRGRSGHRRQSPNKGPQAIAPYSVAMGTNTAVNGTGQGSIAMGYGSQVVSGNGAISLGLKNSATGDGAVAIGDPNVATGTGAVAVGANNTATGQGAIAVGNTNTALQEGAVAAGDNNSANGIGAVAGNDGQATGQGSVAFGNVSTATGESPLLSATLPMVQALKALQSAIIPRHWVRTLSPSAAISTMTERARRQTSAARPSAPMPTPTASKRPQLASPPPLPLNGAPASAPLRRPDLPALPWA